MQNLAVYSLSEAEPRQLLVTGYTRYAARDMDGDGRQDLIVLRSDEESYAVADYYAWAGTELSLRSSLQLTSTVAELSRLTAGTLAGGEAALFVTAVTEDNAALTHILTVSEGALHSVTGNAVRFLELYPGDVNADGVTEVPEPAPFRKADEEEPTYYRVCWRQYDVSGESEVVREAYQDTQSGWSLLLPEDWGERVSVVRGTSAEGSAVTFSYFGGVEPEPFLTVYAFTGDNRASLASRGGRIVLSRQAEVTYAAELYEGGAGFIDESTLRERFGLVVAEWTTGEN